ncbi:MAG TPA: bifunctional salicylyl-CoA 5-hydroxylase/oxidoreductase [Longimicrobiales bacterium]|nr:bifunctional salicylyl-CoA 5-hydroxylase/oxidoreductase [Longimicrobiales bacterium]
MTIAIVGGGPAGLYLAILLKQADPGHDIRVLERNRADDTFGFGVVFSDATIAEVETADADTYRLVTDHFVRWDDIDVHYRGELLRSTGHGFSGMSRQTLLTVLQGRAAELGVTMQFEHEVTGLDELRDADLVVGADGVNSFVRDHAGLDFGTEVDVRPNRFVWLGTNRPFPAFTFYFRKDAHGLWRVHAYQYEPGLSTFIVEAREDTWRAAGMHEVDEEGTVDFLADLFAEELGGHELIRNRSIWRQFPTVRTARWSVGNNVLIGDAAHTAHFSVGSGTRMAMLDAIALARVLTQRGDASLEDALEAYEADRRPQVESLQRAAQASLQWFEDTERYMDLAPVQFAFSLLTRSLRITHEDLRVRDPAFLAEVDRWFAAQADRQVGEAERSAPKDAARPAGTPPPMFTPFRLRDLVLPNRVVVSPMCQYVAADGTVGDWHLQHLGSRAIGGAGLVMAEMTDVSRDARISPWCAGLYRDEHADAWGRIVDFIHGNSDAKVGIQLGHAGRKGATRALWDGGEQAPLEEGAWPLVSASPLPYTPRNQVPREMSRADMREAIADYVAATERAAAAGFDLLEVHMAHGYLLAAFISPLTNERTDAYGGDLAGRMRFPLEVFEACRAAWPGERPMSARISAVDWKPGGMEPDDAVEVARLLAGAGCDIVDVSAGQTVVDQEPVYGRLFQTPFSDRIRHEVGIHTMAVGNISSFMDVNTILAAGRADLCLLARAHLWDPYWTRHAAYTLGWDLEWPDPYKSVQRYTPRLGFRDDAE